MPRLLALQDVILHAEGAAVDLRGAQLDQFEQLLVDAGLGRDLAERQHDFVGVGRQRTMKSLTHCGHVTFSSLMFDTLSCYRDGITIRNLERFKAARSLRSTAPRALATSEIATDLQQNCGSDDGVMAFGAARRAVRLPA